MERLIAEKYAALLGLTVSEISDTTITLFKPTGGKIIATRTDNSYSVYGVTFNATALNDSFYWAIQFAAHCR